MISQPNYPDVALLEAAAEPNAADASAFQSQSQNQSLWAMLDDRMRGRWRIAIILAIILGAALAVLGYKSSVAKFHSVGAVQIAPSAPHVVEPIPEQTIYSYPLFVSTQIQHMRSRTILEAALADEELAALPWSRRPDAIAQLQAGLDVTWDRDSQFVFVIMKSEDARVAQAAVNGILRSYHNRYGRYGGLPLNEIRENANAIERQRQRELNTLRGQRQKIAAKYDTNNLQELERSLIERSAVIETRIAEGRRALERLHARTENSGNIPRIAPTAQELEAIDPKLMALRQKRDQAQSDFEDAKDRYGTTHHLYGRMEREAESAQRQFDEQYQRTLQSWSRLPADQRLTRGTPYEGLSADELRTELASLDEQAANLKERAQQVVVDMQDYDDLQLQEHQVEQQLHAARGRIARLEGESKSLTGIIEVVQLGFLPDKPSDDPRIKRSILGLGLGFMASFGAFFVLGSLDRRAYGASQLRHLAAGAPTCLGVLPDLADSADDPESSDVASHCVHQIRNQIEAVRGGSSHHILAVTSPFQGDGKTSIVMALGWSFAAAGYRTLLIDCDFVGRSLTRQLGLVGREGLKEALRSGNLNGSVNVMPVQNLRAIAAGVDVRFGPENVQRNELAELLAQSRSDFDVVIIDTGPMLGSLESTPVIAAADGVVLTVRRGRSRARLEECVARLKIIGTRCLGVILNCAVRTDCQRYVSEASLAAADQQRHTEPNGHAARWGAEGEHNALVVAMQSRTRVLSETEA